MALNEKEKTTIKDLQTQEQTCIKKYKKYGQDAKDPVLKELFSTLEKNERVVFQKNSCLRSYNLKSLFVTGFACG